MHLSYNNIKGFVFNTIKARNRLKKCHCNDDTLQYCTTSSALPLLPWYSYVPIIIQTPTSNNINISYLNGSSLLVQTDSSGNPLTDMTSWSAIISFSPVVDGNI